MLERYVPGETMDEGHSLDALKFVQVFGVRFDSQKAGEILSGRQYIQAAYHMRAVVLIWPPLFACFHHY